MRTLLIFAALFLLTSPAHALGLEALLEVWEDGPVSFTINGYSAVSNGGDTGTADIPTGAGDIQILASCDSSTGGEGTSAGVDLVVDGVGTHITCDDATPVQSNVVMTSSVTAGVHTVRVNTWKNNSYNYSGADTFRKPTP